MCVCVGGGGGGEWSVELTENRMGKILLLHVLNLDIMPYSYQQSVQHAHVIPSPAPPPPTHYLLHNVPSKCQECVYTPFTYRSVFSNVEVPCTHNLHL